MNKFPRKISDYICLQWIQGKGTIGIIHENGIQILNLDILQYNEQYNREEAKTYIGRQLCNYLKNRTTKEKILSDYWSLQYMNKEEISKTLNLLEDKVKFWSCFFE